MIYTDKSFVSEIDDFCFPNGILNKQIAGCGATEFAINNDEPTVILSPRLGLIESKVNQHPELLEVNGNTTISDIMNFSGNKIISTYDSFYKIREAIDLNKYRILCDEMQFIIKDSAFKGDVVRKMLIDLQSSPKVTYVSATPLENIFKDLSFFKDVPYEEICWINNVIKEKINLIPLNSPLTEAVRIAKAYANNIMIDGTDSVVIFVNSVRGICNIIKRAKLTPENTNVLIADTQPNNYKLKKVGFQRGKLPNKNYPYKPITLCTSAYAAGADFYNKAAVLYIVSDVHLTKPFSIADEIPQIAGRLRLGNKGINLIYKAGNVKYATIEEKKKATQILVDVYNNSEGIVRNKYIQSIEATIKVNGACDSDYMFYNRETEQFEEDELAVVADKYNIEILNTYKSGILLNKGLKKRFKTITIEDDTNTLTDNNRGFRKALKTYINGNEFDKESILLQYPQIEEYMSKITKEKATSLSYQENKIKNCISDENKTDKIKSDIIFTFKGKTQISKAKKILSDIYKKHGINKTAKAIDIVNLLPDLFSIKVIKENGASVKVLIRK